MRLGGGDGVDRSENLNGHVVGRKRVEPFLKRFNISLPVYFASPEDAGQMTQAGIPTTFLINSDRTLVKSFVGYSDEVEGKWRQLLDKHLKPSRKTAAAR